MKPTGYIIQNKLDALQAWGDYLCLSVEHEKYQVASLPLHALLLMNDVNWTCSCKVQVWLGESCCDSLKILDLSKLICDLSYQGSVKGIVPGTKGFWTAPCCTKERNTRNTAVQQVVANVASNIISKYFEMVNIHLLDLCKYIYTYFVHRYLFFKYNIACHWLWTTYAQPIRHWLSWRTTGLASSRTCSSLCPRTWIQIEMIQLRGNKPFTHFAAT